jgi:hypothetical protein
MTANGVGGSAGGFVGGVLGGLEGLDIALLLGLRGVAAEFVGELLGGEGLDDVACLDVLEAGEIDTALDALADFGDVVLDALERGDLALPDFFAIAQDADLSVALDEPSLTTQPAIWPTLVILKTCSTSARPA